MYQACMQSCSLDLLLLPRLWPPHPSAVAYCNALKRLSQAPTREPQIHGCMYFSLRVLVSICMRTNRLCVSCGNMKFICDLFCQVPHAATRGLFLQTQRFSGTICCTHAVIDIVAVTRRILLQGETELIIRSRVYEQSCMVSLYRQQLLLNYKKVSCEIEDFIETHLCELSGILRSCMKQNKDAVWSLVLLFYFYLLGCVLIQSTRTHDIICMQVRIVTFDFSLKYVFHFFSRYLVPGQSVVGTKIFRFQ